MKRNTPRINGFTLIELMIVVAIIGVLAAVAIPKFAELVTKAKESKVKAGLGALRSAISIYYSDVQAYPDDLPTALLTDEKYIDSIPSYSIPAVSGVPSSGHDNKTGITSTFDDSASGAWYYTLPGNPYEGSVFVNCSHPDTKSSPWSSY